ncbi:hypothetical protein [Halarcobacter anaerophilus]|nr:hypothetical protein [Halarcobacter anaerophilus]
MANGTYTVWAMAINSLGQRGKAEDSLIINYRKIIKKIEELLELNII